MKVNFDGATGETRVYNNQISVTIGADRSMTIESAGASITISDEGIRLVHADGKALELKA